MLINGSPGPDTLNGTEDADEINGFGGDDEINGLGGDDLIDPGFGTDTVSGGEGNDVIRFATGIEDPDVPIVYEILNGDGGDDLIILYEDSGLQQVNGGSGQDRLEVNVAGRSTSVFKDQPGDVEIYSDMDLSIQLESIEALIFWGTIEADHIHGQHGDDEINGNGGPDRLWGESGNDLLNGGTLPDEMFGGDGNDIMIVEHSGDVARGGRGVDLVISSISYRLLDDVENLTLTGSAPIFGSGNGRANIIIGNEAANDLFGSTGNDRLEGGGGNDSLSGWSDDDSLHGGDDDDSLSGYSGNDELFGDAGNDELDGDSDNDTLSGGDGADDLDGGSGYDALFGDAGNDTLHGGSHGNDRLDGGTGADSMTGGTGHDTYVVDNVGDVVVEAGQGGTDVVESSIDYLLPTHVDRLVLTGGASIDGRGNTAANRLFGNSGNNLLNGGRGNDRAEGGAGNDRLYGSEGDDILLGGSGKDGFFFNTALGAGNVDDILDFSVANDTIYLARYVFTGIAANGTLSAAAFRQGTAAGDASDRIVYNQATGDIFYDSDGTGAAAAILFATVSPGTALTNLDFVGYS